MIVAEPKPIRPLYQLLEGVEKVLLVGCAECVTVCLAGGAREVGILATSLQILARADGRQLQIKEHTCLRQCEWEYLEELESLAREVEVIISLACGVGVQFLAEKFPQHWVIPGVDTKFAGGAVTHGYWEERCGLCGQCLLHQTGGICPIARCAKRILNGPCGGSQNGRCEVKDNPCAWQLIIERMTALGRLEQLLEIAEEKDWRQARDGGPRQLRREEVSL